jgi:DUF971 family protein
VTASIPQRIHREDRAVVITWSPEHVSRYPSRELRLQCRCAACLEEMTGRPLLDPATVPHDIRPVTISLVGRYAIRIAWSDGHDTGIYTYELLAEICGCVSCRGAGGRGGALASDA